MSEHLSVMGVSATFREGGLFKGGLLIICDSSMGAYSMEGLFLGANSRVYGTEIKYICTHNIIF